MPRSKFPERTRARILDSALEVFAAKGYAQTSMDEIAGRAGVTKGALYWHFEDKLRLYRALVDRAMEMQTAALMPALERASSPKEAVGTLVKAYLRFYRENGLLMAFYSNMMIETKTLSESGVMADMAGAYRSYREAVAAALGCCMVGGTRTVDLAAVLVGALDGIIMQWMIDPDGFEPDQAGEAIVALFSSVDQGE